MYRIYTIIALCFLCLIQFGCYSNVKAERDKIEKETEEKYIKVIAEEKTKRDAEAKKLQEKANQVSFELEQEKKNIKVEFRDIKHETQKIITDRIYSDCKLTSNGLHQLQRSIKFANSSESID